MPRRLAARMNGQICSVAEPQPLLEKQPQCLSANAPSGSSGDIHDRIVLLKKIRAIALHNVQYLTKEYNMILCFQITKIGLVAHFTP